MESMAVEQTTIPSRRSALLMGGAALAGLALTRKAEAQTAAPAITDNDILNFALNLEYLEAQYYSLALTGAPISASLTTGINANGVTSATISPGGSVAYKPTSTKVTFTTPQLAAYAAETANDELNHVKFLRTQLGANAVAQPNIDLFNSFNKLAQAAGVGAAFDPFANETNFLIGSFIFEDVGVSAYLGAAPLIQSSAILAAALGIHAVEAYHAGAVRTQIFRASAAGNQGAGTAAATSRSIASFRAQYDAAVTADIGVGTTTFPSVNLLGSTIVDAPVATGRVQPRTTNQVLSVVYGGGAIGTGGAFFPNGLNASNAGHR